MSRLRCTAAARRIFPKPWRKSCSQRLWHWQPLVGTNAAPLLAIPLVGLMLHHCRPWSVCCTAASEAMGKPRTAFGPLLGAGGPSTRDDISSKEWPQQNRQAAGDACLPDTGSGCRRCGMGKGHTMDDGGLRSPKLPHIPDRDPWGGGRRGCLRAAALLHKRRFNHPCCAQQALRDAPRRARHQRATPTNNTCGVALESKKTKKDWDGEALVRAGRGARGSRR